MSGLISTLALARVPSLGVPHPANARVVHLPDAMRRLFNRAILSGAERKGQHRAVWNVAGDCSAPVWMDHYSRPEVVAFCRSRKDRSVIMTPVSKDVPFGDEAPPPVDPLRERDPYKASCADLLVMAVRCRKCKHCLRWRHRKIVADIEEEIGYAARSWMLTLTMNQRARQRTRRDMLKRVSSGGQRLLKIDKKSPLGAPVTVELTKHELTMEWFREVGFEITNWIKALRRPYSLKWKNGKVERIPGGEFRYSIYPELHEDGTPHFHVVIHELRGGCLRKERLKKTWKHMGFVDHTVIKEGFTRKGALYVAKYVAKALQCGLRLRRSLHYGKPFEALALRMGWKEKGRRSAPEAMCAPENEANDLWMTVDAEEMAKLERALAGRDDQASPEPEADEALAAGVDDCFETHRIRHYRALDGASDRRLGSVLLLQ